MIILVLILAALVVFGFAEADVSQMFVNGYDSLWQIALMMAVFALIYPRFGFVTRTLHAAGSDEEILPGVISRMEQLGYVMEKNDGGVMCFRRKDVVSRLFKMYEDRITMERSALGLEVEGLARDVNRIVNVIETR